MSLCTQSTTAHRAARDGNVLHLSGSYGRLELKIVEVVNQTGVTKTGYLHWSTDLALLTNLEGVLANSLLRPLQSWPGTVSSGIPDMRFEAPPQLTFVCPAIL